MEQSKLKKIKQQLNYDSETVQPMRDELISVGCKELLTPENVDKVLDRKDNKTILVVINSVCGCSAGSGRPGVMLALQNRIIPDELYTLFGGMEKDAIDHYRSKYLPNQLASSPHITLFRNGKPLAILQRSDIDGHSAESIAAELVTVFNEESTNIGPSISVKDFENITQGKYGCYSDLAKGKE
jgi:putative YphP/YqiW family bacilliredoxin